MNIETLEQAHELLLKIKSGKIKLSTIDSLIDNLTANHDIRLAITDSSDCSKHVQLSSRNVGNDRGAILDFLQHYRNQTCDAISVCESLFGGL